MCTGPAFASAMVDLLAADPVQVADEARLAAAWLPHPPASLRIAVLAHALELQGFAEAGTAVRKAWDAAFPPTRRDRFACDTPRIVAALWTGRHDRLGVPLAEALAFTASRQRDAVTVRDTVMKGFRTHSSDVRALIAGARLTFDAEPGCYDTPRGPQGKTPQELILEQILELRDDAPRAEETERSPGPEADRTAGRALFDRISKTIAARPDMSTDRGD
jgi:hypothetical protein